MTVKAWNPPVQFLSTQLHAKHSQHSEHFATFCDMKEYIVRLTNNAMINSGDYHFSKEETKKVQLEPEQTLIYDLTHTDCNTLGHVVLALCRHSLRRFKCSGASNDPRANAPDFLADIHRTLKIFTQQCKTPNWNGVVAAKGCLTGDSYGVLKNPNGFYQGYLQNLIANGEGKGDFKSLGYCEGKFEKGSLVDGTIILEDQTVKLTGKFYRNERDLICCDQCEIEFADGRRYFGALRDARINGRGTFITKQGKKITGEFVNGKPAPSGYKVIVLANKDTYKGEIDPKTLSGKGTFTQADKVLSGVFDRGTLTGEGEIKWTTEGKNVTYKGSFINGAAAGDGEGILTIGGKQYKRITGSDEYIPKEIPQQLACPVTYELMTDPVRIINDGHNTPAMNRATLYNIIIHNIGTQKCVCPLTRKPLTLPYVNSLPTDKKLHNEVSQWLTENTTDIKTLFEKHNNAPPRELITQCD